MASTITQGEQHGGMNHRELAAEHRRQAEQLGCAGDHDQAARHRIEARLHDLAAAASTSSRAA